MKALVALLEDLGAQRVATYVQSGNAVFRINEEDDPALPARISSEIEARHGFRPEVLLLDLEELRRAVASNPFPEAEPEPKTLHLFFPATEPKTPDLDALERSRRASERFALKYGVFYLHAPDGIGRSKLAARVERSLGVPVTARNWRTVSRVLELAEESESLG